MVKVRWLNVGVKAFLLNIEEEMLWVIYGYAFLSGRSLEVKNVCMMT